MGVIQSDVAVGFLLPGPSGESAGERGLACHGTALWMFCGAVDGVIVAILLIAATAHPTGAGGLFDALFVAKKMPQRLARGGHQRKVAHLLQAFPMLTRSATAFRERFRGRAGGGNTSQR